MQTIGVAGLGLMGRGIAACLAAHGFRVIGYTEGEPHTFERARDYLQNAMEELISRAGYPAELASGWQERFIEAGSLAEFRDCEFIVESVFEDLEVKNQVYDELEKAVGASVPIASNTSALPIGRLQERRKHPERMLGMHWSPPAYVTRFLELIRGPKTSDDAMARASELGLRLGKEPAVLNQDVPGFIANRVAYAMYREAVHLLESGVADAETIDRACRHSLGLWTPVFGPFRWIDITGGPALYAKAMQGVLPDLNSERELPVALRKMQEEDCRGTLNGRGFYAYSPEDEAVWEEKAREQAWALRKD